MDFGIIFLHNEGYSDHCGHGVIALATAAAELGWVQRQRPETRVGIDALKQIGAEVNAAANRASTVVHPDIPEINHIYGTIIDGAPRHSGST